MPLTDYQAELARLLASNRSEDSHLAGGAALHIEPNSLRYSNDLDYFHDSQERVARAYQDDSSLLEKNGYKVVIEMAQPGYVRARVAKKKEVTKIEWAHDSAWRFLPVLRDSRCGFLLHPIDLAVNKVLTLAGRNEPRDLVDTIHAHKSILPLGALCWAGAGKDPGFNPRSLLELLKRRGRFQKEDLEKLELKEQIDLPQLKAEWLKGIEDAELFINQRPADEVGCLYYSLAGKAFFAPPSQAVRRKDYELHFGKPGGLIPQFTE